MTGLFSPRGGASQPCRSSCAAAIVKAPKRCPFWITIRSCWTWKRLVAVLFEDKRGPYWWKKSGDHHLGCRKPCKILRPNYQPLVNAGFLVAINSMLVWFGLIWQVHVIRCIDDILFLGPGDILHVLLLDIKHSIDGDDLLGHSGILWAKRCCSEWYDRRRTALGSTLGSIKECQNPIPISSKFTVLLNFYSASTYWFNWVINKNINYVEWSRNTTTTSSNWFYFLQTLGQGHREKGWCRQRDQWGCWLKKFFLVCQQNFLKLLTFFHMYGKQTLLCILSKILADERDFLLHLQRIADSPGSLLASLLPKQFSVFHLERGWSCVSKWLPFRLSVTLMLVDMDLKLVFRNLKSCSIVRAFTVAKTCQPPASWSFTVFFVQEVGRFFVISSWGSPRPNINTKQSDMPKTNCHTKVQ